MSAAILSECRTVGGVRTASNEVDRTVLAARRDNSREQVMTTKGLGRSSTGERLCAHWPPCPDAYASDALAAHVIRDHLEQGWELLCNGIVVFDDHGALLPDGRSVRAQTNSVRRSALAVPA